MNRVGRLSDASDFGLRQINALCGKKLSRAIQPFEVESMPHPTIHAPFTDNRIKGLGVAGPASLTPDDDLICPVTGTYCTGLHCEDYGCAKEAGFYDDEEDL